MLHLSKGTVDPEAPRRLEKSKALSQLDVVKKRSAGPSGLDEKTSSREFWKAKPLTTEEISQLPDEISRYVDPSGYWSKELLAAPFPDGERLSCRWGCSAHRYRSMKEASVHFIQQRPGLGTYVPSCQKYRQKVDYGCQFILCDPSCTIGRTNLHLYLRNHWYHEMRGDGAPCVCEQRFGDPDAAAYHLFWATESSLPRRN